MAASGCIAVSGGLEVADERLLKLIRKGVTLEQVAVVCNNFKQAGIMVHSYLMYGFPTQTDQEIINSLELVRQFMELDLFQSAYWHQFALTIHSPVTQNPEKYKVEILSNQNNPFGNNDLVHKDLTEIDHSKYSQGLKKALYNYMHGVGFENEIYSWFNFKVPKPTVKRNLIGKFISEREEKIKDNAKAFWLGSMPKVNKLDNQFSEVYVSLIDADAVWEFDNKTAEWFSKNLALSKTSSITINDWRKSFPDGEKEFESFCTSEIWKEILESGLLFI